jgi:hypothetical protein
MLRTGGKSVKVLAGLDDIVIVLHRRPPKKLRGRLIVIKINGYLMEQMNVGNL